MLTAISAGKVSPSLRRAHSVALPEIERGIARGRGEALQRLRDRLALFGQLRHEQVDALSDNLGLGVAEYALAGGIEGADQPLLVHREHHVLDVIQNDLQVPGALLVRLEGECARLIRHQAHGFDDPAPLVLDGEVLIVDQTQQHPDIGVRAAGPQLQLAQLRPQVRVQVRIILRERPWVCTDERGGGARSGLWCTGARP